MNRYRKRGRGRRSRQRQKRILACSIIGAIIIVIATFICINVLLNKDKTVSAVPKDEKGESIKDIEIKSIIEEDVANIAVHYPNTENEQVNKVIKEKMDAIVNEFKEKIQSKDKKGNSQKDKDELCVQFDVFRYDKNIVSFKFDTYSYYSGHANGEDKIDTMVFNLSDAKQYSLSDIFQSEDYVDILSKKSYEGLRKLDIYQDKTEAEFLKEGTLPKVENFEKFVLDEEKLILFFDSYQIGSGGNDTDHFEIELEQLKDILKPEIKTKQAIIMDDKVPATTNATISEPDSDEALKDKKLIALTFDDGPHGTWTPELLDILQEEEVKATFFVLGSRAEFYQDILKQIFDEGHQIGSHTYNHKQLTTLSDKERKKEINDTVNLIRDITGKKPTTMRPPYGAINDSVRKDANVPLILWSVDPEDWKYKNANTVYKKVIKNVNDGDIILLHDIHKSSVQAVKKIIPKLKKEGYTFVTVDQLIRIRGTAENGKAYRFLRPSS